MYNKMLRGKEKGREREKGGRKRKERRELQPMAGRSGRLLWKRLAMRGGEGGPDRKLHLWSQCPHSKLGAISLSLSVPTSCPRPF